MITHAIAVIDAVKRLELQQSAIGLWRMHCEPRHFPEILGEIGNALAEFDKFMGRHVSAGIAPPTPTPEFLQEFSTPTSVSTLTPDIEDIMDDPLLPDLEPTITHVIDAPVVDNADARPIISDDDLPPTITEAAIDFDLPEVDLNLPPETPQEPTFKIKEPYIEEIILEEAQAAADELVESTNDPALLEIANRISALVNKKGWTPKLAAIMSSIKNGRYLHDDDDIKPAVLQELHQELDEIEQEPEDEMSAKLKI